MTDVAEKIIAANVNRHGRATVWASISGGYYANGYSGLGIDSPMPITPLEQILSDRFCLQDGTDDAITSFTTRSFTVSTGVLPLTGIPEGTKIQLKASASNTGLVYVGNTPNVTANSNAETDGFPLSADQGIYIPVVQTGQIYLVSPSLNNKVFIFGV
jgi:hypothetical protein